MFLGGNRDPQHIAILVRLQFQSLDKYGQQDTTNNQRQIAYGRRVRMCLEDKGSDLVLLNCNTNHLCTVLALHNLHHKRIQQGRARICRFH